MARRINLSEMDFDGIKGNLIEYMQAQEDSAVSDYNFKGSAVNTVMDMLAYITHVNAVNANMALNETFLDTAQLRESVVSHAKLLGYTPRSTKSAIATVNIMVNSEKVNGAYEWNTELNEALVATPQQYVLDYGTPVTTQFNGKSHNLIIGETVVATPDETGTWFFYNVPLIQGTVESRTYKYDDTNSEKYLCYDAYVDTQHLKVNIQTSASSSESTPFTRSSNITNIISNSNVFFLEETREGFFEILFGDGKIGKKLSLGNLIHISYVVTGPENINGAKTFTLSSLKDGVGNSNSDIVITTIEGALGGIGKEAINSIKYNAPRAYTAQNRAVTPEDYKAILQNEFADIHTIAVWGGEDNIPPEYGKVFISIKPTGNSALTIDQKTEVVSIITPKNVVSIKPVIVDPAYIDIGLNIAFKFDSNITNISGVAIAEVIRSNLAEFNLTELNLFGGIFRHSNITKLIDNSDPSIISSIATVTMSKSFTANLDYVTSHKIEFNQPIGEITPGSNIISTLFTYSGKICKLQDYYNADEGKTIIRILNSTGQVINPNIGWIDLNLGCVYLDNFKPTSIYNTDNNDIVITTKPASPDIKPLRNDLLRLNVSGAVINPDVDSVVTGGTSAAITYNTAPGGY